MTQKEKFEHKLFDKSQRKNIKFDDLIKYLNSIPQLSRLPKKGGSHIYAYLYNGELINLQRPKNKKVKKYQMEQVLEILELIKKEDEEQKK